MTDSTIIEQLYQTIKERKKANPEESYVAKLFTKGRGKIAQKVGEEAVETVIDAVAGNKKGAVSESADLLFHLLVLWADMGIKPESVYKELEKRKGVSGIEEKKGRKV
ncbi:MAG: phosphoribosyl-ATP diphosphatase [Rickettsiaceae bacterium]|jgi:phosphoribosyl-ATP pyrophosphohydrolase|nr:phosphoribosyl-ATP diphosphatase [Rickettsiaceae bacterium]